jgi:hypothetical protein
MRLCVKSGLVTTAVFLFLWAGTAGAAQVTVTQVDPNPDGTTTYHFSIKVGETETMGPAASNDLPADFVTIYNFYGLIEGSVKTPDGWQFSSEASGRTPGMGGYPLVLPIDIPGTPNITWTVTAPVKPGTEITGFSATTRMGTMTEGNVFGTGEPAGCADQGCARLSRQWGDGLQASPDRHDRDAKFSCRYKKVIGDRNQDRS